MEIFEGCQIVIHLAARVHLLRDNAPDAGSAFHRTNVVATSRLARQAATAGVRRFVFLSSVKVNGEFTELYSPFTADDLPSPSDPYGISKHEAELQLREIAKETGMELVIIRSPLVYGAGVRANFESLMGALVKGWPMPLGAVTQNRRSLVAMDNLVDLIIVCLSHPVAANQTFMVSDGEDISTADLLTRLAAALGKSVRLFDVPVIFLKLGAILLNKYNIYQRLCGSLQVDITKTQRLLGWTPPISVDEGLRRSAAGVRR
jgi:nucleoside-diphosphate-sugar epimerase